MELEQQLAEIVGPDHVLTDPQLRAGYERDWTRRFGGPARAVVRPADTAEVQAVMRACAAAGAGIVPQGGNTGLVGGSVPRGGEVVLSMTRLTAISEVAPVSGQVTAGAGVTLAALQRSCAAAGVDAGLDFGARDGATLGGIAACNAGGIRALRYGTARQRIVGLEAVLADGSLVSRMSGMLKDNAGYDLPELLIGSEGTLAVITAVRWQSVPRHEPRIAALVPVASTDAALAVLASLRLHAPSLESCDFFDDASLQLVLQHASRVSPVQRPAPLYVLTELASDLDPTAELATALEHAGVADVAVIADDSATRASLWGLREAIPEASGALGIAHKVDVGVPAAQLARFLDALPTTVRTLFPEAQLFAFGHLADGNVHVAIVGPPPEDTTVDGAILEHVIALGGTISAEHGVGVAKVAWLSACRGDDEFRAIQAIKTGLDPAGTLNPGVLLPR